MKSKLTLSLLLFSISLATSQNIENGPTENDTDPAEAIFTGMDYDFVMKMIYTISEEKVPAHLVNLIFTSPEEGNISSKDIVNLFNLPNLTISKVLEILELTNIPINSAFSIGGLDNLLNELHWGFTEFYNSIISKINAVGNPVRNALDALHIDSAQFSLGITFGDPDPYVEFKKGNFTYENMQNATTQLGITLDELFAIVTNNSLEKLTQMGEKDVVAIFTRNHINQQQALAVWHNQSLTMENVYNVENLRNYLMTISDALSVQTTLGVAIENNTIAINKKTFMIWKNISQVIDISASAFTTTLEVSIDELNPIHGDHTNIVTLKSNASLNYLDPGRSSHDLQNCTLITLVNDNLILQLVNATNNGETLALPRSTTSSAALGSPLVCNNQIYGILKEENADQIILDSFSTYLDGPNSHASLVLPSIFISLFMLITFRAF